MNAARLEGRASPSPVGVEGVRRKGRIRSLTPATIMLRLCAFVDLSASGGADHPASRHFIAAGSRSYKAGPRRWHIGLTRPASASRRRSVWGPGSNPR